MARAADTGDDVASDPQGIEVPAAASGWAFASSIPCAFRDGDGWSIPTFPTPEDVAAFFSLLTEPYEAQERAGDLEFADGSGLLVGPWFKVLDPEVDPLPEGRSWASPAPPDDAAVRMAASVLGGQVAGSFVHRWKASDVYPAGWGYGLGQFRSTVDRLLDRLHLQHATWSGQTVRVARWWDRVNDERAPQETAIGFAGGENPMGLLFAGLNRTEIEPSLGGNLFRKDLIRPYLRGWPRPTDSFPFPLDWNEALRFGLFDSASVLGTELILGLPTDARRSLVDAAGLIDETIDGLDILTRLVRFYTTARKRKIVKNIDDVALRNTVRDLLYWRDDWPGDDPGTAGRRLWAAIEVLQAWPEALRQAADWEVLGQGGGMVRIPPAPGLDETLYHLATAAYHAASTSEGDGHEVGEALLGMDSVGIIGLVSGLANQDASFADGANTGWDASTQVVWLTDNASAAASAFGSFAAGGRSWTSDQPAATEEHAWALWDEWWRAAAPTADAARVFFLVGELTRQLVNLDDLWSVVFAALRARNAVQGVLTAALGATIPFASTLLQQLRPPADVLGYLVRQVLTDSFIEFFVEHRGIERDCLAPLFCWFDTPNKRKHVDAALGPLVRVSLPIELQGELRRRFGATAATFPVRACMVPGGGAPLGLLFSHVPTGFQSAANQALDIADAILKVDDWWRDARESCAADIEAALRPPFRTQEPDAPKPEEPGPRWTEEMPTWEPER
jgi:hypothetical protein